MGWRVWKRVVAGVLGVGVGILMGAAWSGLLGERTQPVPSAAAEEATGPAAEEATGTDTYILSDPEIRYPYHTTPPGEAPVEGTVDPTRAGVSFATRWSGSRFPGEVWCTVVLRNPEGAVVGQERFGAMAVLRVSRIPWVPVEVTEKPASAEGACEPGKYEAGPGYTFEQVEVRREDPRTATVTATARWTTSTHPTYRSCGLRAVLTGGRTFTFPFGLYVPDGTPLVERVPAPVSDVKEVSISCSAVPEAPAG